jgi:hypothetical protein
LRLVHLWSGVSKKIEKLRKLEKKIIEKSNREKN